MAEPSLSNDSPVMCIFKRSGAPTSLKSALTATGSVAARIDPKAMQKLKDQP
eukprot:CAMPEP_0194218516 /NCGR_PEP_ID=MMETSP0156-20130528/23954_2 /TAXON_ID=33649 /ORGANISM="Thalassionema nitzschioides, Strain L26-B" /LENGTH=51 /DNA_ID=CAMNT_0038947903 /DNA_START=45 /DNA_END=200 /DNA_ORIENTATION=-